eukprot:351228-Chlamydomonas_euryale.AAC.3
MMLNFRVLCPQSTDINVERGIGWGLASGFVVLTSLAGCTFLLEMHARSYLSTKTYGVGTTAYMAPECFTNEGRVSCQSDVYSTAVVIGELINHSCPWHHLGSDAAIMYQVGAIG